MHQENGIQMFVAVLFTTKLGNQSNDQVDL